MAVQVHTINVSKTGPSVARMPSRMGSLVLAAPCAMTSVPTPASFEKAPRLMPISITPRKPPPTALGDKASRIMVSKIPGTAGRLLATTQSVISRYTPTIVGSKATATLATLGKPPKMTIPTTAAKQVPMTSAAQPGAVPPNAAP